MSYECSCDYDPPEIITTRVYSAKKEHTCDECGRQIGPGEKYEYVWGKWEGDVSVVKTCPDCMELRQWAEISVPCFCYAFGNLHEEAREMVSEIRRDIPGIIFEWGRRIVKIDRKRGRRLSSVLNAEA